MGRYKSQQVLQKGIKLLAEEFGRNYYINQLGKEGKNILERFTVLDNL